MQTVNGGMTPPTAAAQKAQSNDFHRGQRRVCPYDNAAVILRSACLEPCV